MGHRQVQIDAWALGLVCRHARFVAFVHAVGEAYTNSGSPMDASRLCRVSVTTLHSGALRDHHTLARPRGKRTGGTTWDEHTRNALPIAAAQGQRTGAVE